MLLYLSAIQLRLANALSTCVVFWYENIVQYRTVLHCKLLHLTVDRWFVVTSTVRGRSRIDSLHTIISEPPPGLWLIFQDQSDQVCCRDGAFHHDSPRPRLEDYP